jgi:hypothetical protein
VPTFWIDSVFGAIILISLIFSTLTSGKLSS